ncbi:MAG: hypothetical protein J6S48_04245 [Bacteroidales bacterium]|nr:hypothetical protein [Bacteroidales bacterium]
MHAAVGGRPFTPRPHRMSAFPPAYSMAKYYLDSTLPVRWSVAMTLGRICAGLRFPVGDTDL